MLPFTGCINDDTLCPDGTREGSDKGVTLEFSVVTHKSESTRALLPPSGTKFDGTAADNYLDLDNLLFLLFDNSPDPQLMQVFKPSIEAEDIDTYIKYKVKAIFNDFTFFKTENPTLTFSIVVIGNYMGHSPNDFGYHKGQTLSQIFNQARVGTFAMPISNNDLNSWIPSIGRNNYTNAFNETISGMTPAHIPMAGMQTFTVNTADLEKSSIDSPLQLSPDESKEINMLRALAKIEVVDRMGLIGTEDSRSWIEKVELIGYETRGSILPSLDQWNRSGLESQYVNAPSIPNSASFTGVRPNENFGINADGYNAVVNFFADRVATETRGDGHRVFSCYLTEYNPIPELLLEQEPMWIRITANSPGVVANDGSSSTFYRLKVAPYGDNGEPGDNMRILRNNVYRYEITGITTSLDLSLQVQPWNMDLIEWDYSDNPGVAEGGYMEWQTANPDFNRNNATIYYTGLLTGTFIFSQPLDGEWTAVFAPGPNTEPDAFEFIDAKGDAITGNIATGKIDGNPAVIRIRAKYEALPSENRSAILIFSVRTPDGRTISAPLVGPGWGDKEYFTIIQRAAL